MITKSMYETVSELNFTKSATVARCPKRRLQWNSFYLRMSHTSVMLILSIMISVLQLSLATEQTFHPHRHHKRSSSSSHGHEHELTHHHRHERSENLPLTLNECSNEQYPKELDNWMDRLTKHLELLEAINETQNHPVSQNVSLGEVMAKFKEELQNGKNFGEDRQEPLEIGRDTDPNETWGPNDKLLGSKQKWKGSRFRLVQKELHCPTGSSSKIFHWHPIWGTHTKIPECCPTNLAKHELSNMSLIAEDGNLVWNKVEGERHVYERKDYCVWRRGTEKSGWVSFKVCASNCSDSNRACIRKCCLPNEVVNVTMKGCIPADPRWSPRFYRSTSESEKKDQQQVPNLSFIVGFVECEKYFINESPNRNFKLLLNGTLVQIDGAKKTFIKAGEFCIDGIYLSERHTIEKKGRGDYEGVGDKLSEWDQVVVACEPNTYKQEVDKWRMPMFSTLYGLSSLFLFLTLVVYLLLWRHQNIHGWLQFAYAFSLFCTFNTFFVVQQWSQNLMKISAFLCKMMGWITHLTYLSAFFWLTSMNFDLWWRFSRPLRTTRMTPKEKKISRFLGFAVFSICIPLMISSIGITMDYIYKDAYIRPPYIPGFGIERCYFMSRESRVPYLYGPAGILLLIDLVFFTSTVFHLRKMHAHTELARTQSTMEDKKGLRVIAKLFVVMGVLWIFELVSWIGYLALPDQELTLIWIFMPIDVLNSLQGVAIFIIFVCKPNVGNQLLAMFRTGISKTNFLQLQQSNNQSNQTNSSNIQGSNETIFTVRSDNATTEQ